MEAVKTVGPVGKLFAGREDLPETAPRAFLPAPPHLASQGRRRVIFRIAEVAGGNRCEDAVL